MVKECDVQGIWISPNALKVRIMFREKVGPFSIVFELDAGSDESCEKQLSNSEMKIEEIKELKINNKKISPDSYIVEETEDEDKKHKTIKKIHIKRGAEKDDKLELSIEVENQGRMKTLLCDVFSENQNQVGRKL